MDWIPRAGHLTFRVSTKHAVIGSNITDIATIWRSGKSMAEGMLSLDSYSILAHTVEQSLFHLTTKGDKFIPRHLLLGNQMQHIDSCMRQQYCYLAR